MKTTFWGGVATLLLLVAAVGPFLTENNNATQTFAQDATLVSAASTLHPVEVFSVDSRAKSVVEAFALADKPYYPEDKVALFPTPELGIGTVITVQRALPVTLQDGKKSKTVRTWADTTGGLLSEKKIELGAEDRISPSLDTKVRIDTKVLITRVARTTVTENEVIPYETTIQKDYNQFVGPQTVVEAGKNGQREKKYLLIREDGELKSKTLTSNTVVVTPHTAVVKQGGLNPVPSQCAIYKDLVVAAAGKYKLDPNSLYYRMIRESNCHTNSVGHGNSGQTYYGLFQYELGYWTSISAKAGFAGADWTDAKAQIYTTAYAWSHNDRGRWPNP